MTRDVTITTFGYGHDGPPPTAEVTLDLRHALRNPLSPALRHLTGLDQPVADHLFTTTAAWAVVRSTVAAVDMWLALTAGPMRVAVGCCGGRHRSVAVAVRVAAGLASLGYAVTLIHRDIDRPVITMETTA